MLLCTSCGVLRELRERFQCYFPPWCNADGRFPCRFAERIKWDDVWFKSSWPNRNLSNGDKTSSSSSSSLTSYQRWENTFIFIATQGYHLQKSDSSITGIPTTSLQDGIFTSEAAALYSVICLPEKLFHAPSWCHPISNLISWYILFQVLKSCFISWPLGCEFLKKREKPVHLSIRSTQYTVSLSF